MDLDFTFIIMLCIVMAVLVVASRILARPFLQAVLERESRIEGAKGQAAKLTAEAQKLTQQREDILTGKRQEFSAKRTAEIAHVRHDLQLLQHGIQKEHAQQLADAQKDITAFQNAAEKKLTAVTADLSGQLVTSLLAKGMK